MASASMWQRYSLVVGFSASCMGVIEWIGRQEFAVADASVQIVAIEVAQYGDQPGLDVGLRGHGPEAIQDGEVTAEATLGVEAALAEEASIALRNEMGGPFELLGAGAAILQLLDVDDDSA
jgi:hypothetical protein